MIDNTIVVIMIIGNGTEGVSEIASERGESEEDYEVRLHFHHRIFAYTRSLTILERVAALSEQARLTPR